MRQSMSSVSAVVCLAVFSASCGSSPQNPLAPTPAASTAALSVTMQSNGMTTAKGGGGKADVCHRDEDGGVKLINVSTNAVPAHMAHGDGQPGMATGDGGTFGADCSASYTLELRSGANGGPGSLDANVTFTMGSQTGQAVILSKHPAYHAIAGAQWINWARITGWHDHGFGTGHNGQPVTYSSQFTLPANVGQASISGTALADNVANAYLNGSGIGGHGVQNPASYTGFNTLASYGSTTGFVAGTNTFSIVVDDGGGVAGLTFKATVTYTVPAKK